MKVLEYNVIVVGAGSAGIPLAARLSEDPNRKVLLEAGPRFKTIDDYPPELRHGGLAGHYDPAHPNNWAFDGELTTQGVRQILPRGKVVGGGSAFNGTIFERGLPEDFNEWAAKGNTEWSYDKVLPYFPRPPLQARRMGDDRPRLRRGMQGSPASPKTSIRTRLTPTVPGPWR